MVQWTEIRRVRHVDACSNEDTDKHSWKKSCQIDVYGSVEVDEMLPVVADGFLMFIVPGSVYRGFHPKRRATDIDRRYGELIPRCGSCVQPGVVS